MEIPPDEDFNLIINQHWDISNFTVTDLKSVLCEKIKDLITHDFHKLITILYRLDVAESILDEAMNRENIDSTASFLTHKILEREIIRYKYRKLYQSNDQCLEIF